MHFSIYFLTIKGKTYYENLSLGYHGNMFKEHFLNFSSLVFVKQIFVILKVFSIYKVISSDRLKYYLNFIDLLPPRLPWLPGK